MQPKEMDQGFMTFAQGEQYLQCAYLLALSVKLHCKHNNFTVVVDHATEQNITESMQSVFDNVIAIDSMQPFRNECLAWNLTPYKETIKLESDMLVTSSLDYMWSLCRTNDVAFTNSVANYRSETVDDSEYRSMWRENCLANVYNGFMYFRHSVDTMNFFKLSLDIFDNYSIFKDKLLKNCRHDKPDTDIVFSIAASLSNLNTQNRHLRFVHMKQHVNQFETPDWRDAVSYSLTDDNIFIVNGYAQTLPFHYYEKDFCTQELISSYEQRVF